MEEVKKLLAKADDDYLAGISNKGILKRAYKDLEKESPSLSWKGAKAHVTLKEEECVICAPFGESTCSCPSRNVCRHVITAILWLKKMMSGEEGGEDGKPPAPAPERFGDAKGLAPGQGMPDDERTPKSPAIFQELLNIPVKDLKRACKGRKFAGFLAHINAGEFPNIKESSIVAVEIPWEGAKVKLVEPFAYSTCTCHSKELCVHKAQAVLAYQLAKGKLSLEELKKVPEQEAAWEKGQARKVCETAREEICHQLCTGLSRQSPEAAQLMERLAVIAHSAGIPSLENLFRQASSDYANYFSRSALFRSRELLGLLLKLYRLSGQIGIAESQGEFVALAGTFRDNYELIGDLHLMGIGAASVKTKSGYEGETYYFLESRRGEWYTWTDVRPVFYEGTRKRNHARQEGAAAPWGLSCSRGQMLELEFVLKEAKTAYKNRLSVSKETKGEINGTRDLQSEAFRNRIVWDYESLLVEHFTKDPLGESKQSERLALVGARRWGKTAFDKVEQRFSWNLTDEKGHNLFLSFQYSKEEQMLCSLLERLEKRLEKRPPEAILFFGSLYLDQDGRLCMYPIEFFAVDGQGEGKEEGDFLENSAKPGEESKNWIEKDKGAEKRKLPSLETLAAIRQYCEEAARQVDDLFLIGFYSADGEWTDQAKIFAEEGKRLGLHQAGELFYKLSSLLKGRRHQMEFEPGPAADVMARLYEYLRLCEGRLALDQALLSMR